MHWLINLIKQKMSTHSNKHEEIIAKTDLIISGQDKSSKKISEQKKVFKSDLRNLTNRARMVTRRANDTTYYMARATGGL